MIETQTPVEIYLAALEECKDVFARVHHEETTPYTLLSWALSRVIGTEPKDHVPSSRWHNALCVVSDRDVADYATWSKAAFDLHMAQLAEAADNCRLETYRYCYQSCSYMSLPDLEHETTAFIDKEIKRVYPAVRRNTKRWRELVASVQVKSRKLTALSLIARMESKRYPLVQTVASDKREADKVRAVAYELEQASSWALKLCPDRLAELGAATRNMLDARLAHAAKIEQRMAGDLETIETFIAKMTEIEKGVLD